MAEMLEKIHEIIGDPERVRIGNVEDCYVSDALGHVKGHASALVFAQSTEEVSRLLAAASRYSWAVTPHGAGTNLVGSTVPTKDNVIIDVSRMNKILELDTENLTATVEPGVLLAQLAEFAEDHGLFYPPDPGDRHASIGGNVATNAGGMRAVKYGVTRDYVMALECVLASGEVLQLGSKNRKDATGLDLVNVLVGSEGTLGIVTKITVKLLARPAASQSALFSFARSHQAWDFISAVLHSGVNPTAVEFIAQSVARMGEAYTGVRLSDVDAECYGLLTVDGTEQQVAAGLAQLQELAQQYQAADVEVLSSQRSADVWRLRGSLGRATEAVSVQEPMDIVVPIAQVGTFAQRIEDLERETGVRMVAFGHAGDGNVHLSVMKGERSEEQWAADRANALSRIYDIATDLGGLISAEHGVGVNKRPYFFKYTDPRAVTLMQGIKAVFDPQGILNPGVGYAAD
ncbi:MAG: FAD-binding protein [Arcanobacterium sp.]|nr:FAD-binding protein [Arcanobacterium sp.]MDY5589028.1 FAD-linked oxidase C-terminal domain-containing protein [Arcanobacterium sp.]